MKYSAEVLEIAKRIGREPEEVFQARALKPEALRSLVEEYVREEGQGPAHWRLLPAKELVTPLLVEVVQRPDSFRKPANKNSNWHSPGLQALALLEPGKHRELIPTLRRLVRKNDVHVLKTIDQHVMAFGSKDLLEESRRLLTHEDERVRSGARGGAFTPLENGTADDPTRLLVFYGKDKAEQLLKQPEILRPDHPLLWEIILTLNKLETSAPEDFLKNLLQTRNESKAPIDDNIANAALVGLCLWNPGEADRIAVQVISNWKNYPMQRVLSAWNVRFKAAGKTSISDLAAYEADGYELDSLSVEFRIPRLIFEFDGDFSKMGSLSEPYCGNSGGYAKETADAFEKIGATQHAEIIRQANRLFGSSGPLKDYNRRQEQVGNLSDKKTAQMEQLSEQYASLHPALLLLAEWEWNQANR